MWQGNCLKRFSSVEDEDEDCEVIISDTVPKRHYTLQYMKSRKVPVGDEQILGSSKLGNHLSIALLLLMSFHHKSY